MEDLPYAIQNLLVKTRACARQARELLDGGELVVDALRESGVMNMFDGGGFPESENSGELTESERRQLAYASCRDLEAYCEELLVGGSGDWQKVFFKVQELYRELAVAAPELVLHHEIHDPIEALGFDFGEALEEVREMLTEAVGRLGHEAVQKALLSWSPDDNERKRLSNLAGQGDPLEALRQSLNQALFAAELEAFDP